MAKEKEVNPIINLLKTEWKYLGNNRKKFRVYIFLFFISNIIDLANPLVIGMVFNSIQESITSQAELKTLILKISLLLVITIGFWVFHSIARIMESRTGFLVRRNYLNSKISKVLELPVSWHKDHHSGDTIDKINKGTDGISKFSRFMTFRLVEATVAMFGSLIILLFIDLYAAIFAFIFSVITLFIIFKLDQRLVEQYKELNRVENKTAAAVFDYLSNILTVITLKLKKTVKKEVDKRMMAGYETLKENVKLNEVKWAFASVAISLMTVIVLSWRSYMDFTTGGVIMIGTLYMLYGYLSRMGHTFYYFASLYGEIVQTNARLINAQPIDDSFDEIKKDIGGRLPNDWKTVELKNVSFRYDENGKKIHIDNANIKFRRGQKIAFIGESGSGKSTILALLRGLYPSQTGDVFCNGKRLEKGLNTIKSQVTLIPQDPEIFNNTIGYNITMDIHTRKDAREKAIDMAQFRDVLDRLEDGLNTSVLEKGVSLSGGEKQRLALVRGLLAASGSDIILMDEPTSSVDTLNESKIYDNVFNYFKEKTIISAVHKLNLLDKFDYIYLFSHGKIISEGTLEELKEDFNFKKFSSRIKLK